ncbi:MAG: hypothetical protein CMN76_10500 [Spirochaetaceae bacterium]|nr:hypothetical protein [Spirochaetaceae bacterium]
MTRWITDGGTSRKQSSRTSDFQGNPAQDTRADTSKQDRDFIPSWHFFDIFVELTIFRKCTRYPMQALSVYRFYLCSHLGHYPNFSISLAPVRITSGSRQ